MNKRSFMMAMVFILLIFSVACQPAAPVVSSQGVIPNTGPKGEPAVAPQETVPIVGMAATDGAAPTEGPASEATAATEVATAVATQRPADDKDAAALLKQAKDFYDQKDFPKAAKSLAEAIKLDPNNAEVNLYMGLVLYENGMWDKAITYFQKASTLDPKPELPFNMLGKAYLHVGNAGFAITAFNNAIQRESAKAENYELRGLAHLLRNDYKLAVADEQKAVALDPENPDTLNELCWVSSLAGHAAEVLESCEKAVHLEPDSWQILDSRALARALAGDTSGAIEDFQKAVEMANKETGNTTYVSEREAFIAALQKGENPFTKEVLKKLATQ